MKRTIFEVGGVKVEELSGPDIPEWSGYERREGPLLQIDAPGGALLTMGGGARAPRTDSGLVAGGDDAPGRARGVRGGR